MMLNMTRKILIGALVPLLSAPAWSAGYEFARFNYTNLYSKDTKISAAYSWFTYDIDGTGTDGQSTGNVLDNLDYFQGGLNWHINDQFSANLQYYRAFNLDTRHEQGLYEGAGAFLRTRVLALTGLYHINKNFSVFAGPTFNQTEIKVDFDGAMTAGLGRIHSDFGKEYGYGYTVGASYEIPEIALRATIGYQSKVKFDFNNVKESGAATQFLTGMESVTGSSEVVMPQSVTFDFQTGIAPKTLLLANIHWRNWESHTIETTATKALYGAPFVTFAQNTFDYGLGLAYQFTPKFVMFTEGVYGEGAGEDGIVNPLAPGNGTTTFKLGGRYDIGDFSLFMVGSYIWLKDGVSKPVDGPNASFEDNTVFALSTGFEYKF